MLRICGFGYQVTRCASRDVLDALGCCEPDSLLISIAADIPDQQQQSALVHEVIEAMSHHLSIGLDDAQIRRLETAWYTFLVDNGISVRALLDKAVAP